MEGDREAQEALVERMRCVGRILAVRNARLGRPLTDDELADLAQETLLRAWSKIGDFAGRAALETWLYSFCYYELMNRVREKSRRPRSLSELEEHGFDPAATPAPIVDTELAHHLRHLAPREAEVIRLCHVERLSFPSIGEQLGISRSSVKTHYYRAIEKLRRVLPKTADEEAGHDAGTM